MGDFITKDNLSKMSIAALLGLIIWASFSGEFVWKNQYAEIKADRDRWEQLALKGTALAETAAHVGVPQMVFGAGPDAFISPEKLSAKEVEAKLQKVEDVVAPAPETPLTK